MGPTAEVVFGGKPVDLWGAQRAASFLPQTKCQALDLLMLDSLMVHENFVPLSSRAPTPKPATRRCSALRINQYILYP
jgi:hypothetical protein